MIANYYPVTSTERLTEHNVGQSLGFRKISERVEQEFINQKTYRGKWEKFASELKKKLKKPVSHEPELTSGASFMGEIILKETKLDDFAFTKTLTFHISILGPFFTIYGVDHSTVFSKLDYPHGPQTGHFTATNALTISPLFEYQELFTAVEKEIRAFFPGYLFVPYKIGMTTIKNISIKDDSRDPRMMDTVYEGIFGTRSVHDCQRRGDERYGFKDWLKPKTANEKALHEIIAAHIKNSSDEITMHKVWKLKESKALGTFTKTGNLMFGMELYDVIDLTDPSELILISDGERGTIGKASYTLHNSILKFSPHFSLRVAELTKDTLTLVVKVDFENDGVSLKGEIKEMKFVQMHS